MITKLKQLHYKDITMSSLTSNYNEGIPTYTKFSNSCKSKLYKCFKLDNYPSNLMYIFMYPLNSDNKDFLNTIKAIINT
jgi:hypothetical protein